MKSSRLWATTCGCTHELEACPASCQRHGSQVEIQSTYVASLQRLLGKILGGPRRRNKCVRVPDFFLALESNSLGAAHVGVICIADLDACTRARTTTITYIVKAASAHAHTFALFVTVTLTRKSCRACYAVHWHSAATKRTGAPSIGRMTLAGKQSQLSSTRCKSISHSSSTLSAQEIGKSSLKASKKHINALAVKARNKMIMVPMSERERERERGRSEELAHDQLFTLTISPWAVNHLLRIALHYVKPSKIPRTANCVKKALKVGAA